MISMEVGLNLKGLLIYLPFSVSILYLSIQHVGQFWKHFLYIQLLLSILGVYGRHILKGIKRGKKRTKVYRALSFTGALFSAPQWDISA